MADALAVLLAFGAEKPCLAHTLTAVACTL
jgi:hypothetical protein